MFLVHCSRNKIADNWVEAIANEFGSDSVALSSNIKDKSKVEIAVCWKAPMRMFHDYPNLKLIQSMGAGVDHIFDNDNVVDGATIARIVDPQLSEDMYEFVLTIILNDLKHLTTYRDQQKQNDWNIKTYRTISQVKIGILGLGVIGKLVAKKLSSLGFNTLGWSNSEKQIQNVSCFTTTKGLHEMLAQSDYLVNLLPLTNETRGFINADLITKLKTGAYVINVGRGPHVVDADLIQALDDEKLSGAALDVFHKEPLEKEHPFWSHPKILLTPHIASITNLATARQQVFENIRRHRSGKEILNQVSKTKGY